MNNLAKVRKTIGISQNKLAIQLGCRQSSIANYETGMRTPSLNNARRIVEVLNRLGANCTLDDVFPVS